MKKELINKMIAPSTSTSNVIGLKSVRMINNAVDELLSRAFAERLGRSWYSDSTGIAKRNIYESLGYIKNLTFQDFAARFKRGDIAKRIVSAPVDASWRLQPTIAEVRDKDDKKDTEFEEGWKQIVKDQNIFHYLSRADKISGIGEYGVLLMGFDDGLEMSAPVVPSQTRKLLYLMPYTQINAGIEQWDGDPHSPRFNLPNIYKIKMNNFRGTGISSELVHHSRIMHLAEDCMENNVYGTPRLEAVFNRLQDLELVVGGSGEMFWRGALPGFNFKMDADADPATVDVDDIKDQIEKYIHGLQRFLRTQAIDAQPLVQPIVSPKEHAEVQLMLISGTNGIPVRILVGSERGELASSQDESNWMSKIDERREQYVEPMILRPFIQRMIDLGVIPPPKNKNKEFSITWPSLFTPSEDKRAETAKKKTEALATYVNARGADQIVPVEVFLREFLEFDDDKIKQIEEQLKGYANELKKELADIQRQTQPPPVPGQDLDQQQQGQA